MHRTGHRDRLVGERGSRWKALLFSASVLVLSAMLLAGGGLLTASRATALLHEMAETGRPGYLSISSDQPSTSWQRLAPGDTLHWQIAATLRDVQESTLALDLRSEGTMIDAAAVRVSVDSCPTQFVISGGDVRPNCASTSTRVVEESSLASISTGTSGELFVLPPLVAESPRYFLITLMLAPALPLGALTDTSMRIGVGLHASGDDGSATPQPFKLATTGTDLAAVALVAFGAAGLVIGLTLIRGSRHRPLHSEDDQ